MVIYRGVIFDANLQKRYYNVNDLLEMLRKQGIFDPQQVEIALIESDGQLSVLKKQEYQTPISKDLNLQAPNQLSASALAGKELVIDGVMNEQNLAKAGMTRESLLNQLHPLGISDIGEVTVALISPEGKLYIDTKEIPDKQPG